VTEALWAGKSQTRVQYCGSPFTPNENQQQTPITLNAHPTIRNVEDLKSHPRTRHLIVSRTDPFTRLDMTMADAREETHLRSEIRLFLAEHGISDQ
jgi:hypothetical protein